jgi:hypothetical protein
LGKTTHQLLEITPEETGTMESLAWKPLTPHIKFIENDLWDIDKASQLFIISWDVGEAIFLA